MTIFLGDSVVSVAIDNGTVCAALRGVVAVMHNKTLTICFCDMLLCLLQMTMRMLLQPYGGWWV